MLYELSEEYEKKEYGYELAVKTDIARIFLWIVRYWHDLNIDLSDDLLLSDDMIKIIQKVINYVFENYSDDIKAYEMADMCNLSYSYFSRIFKHYMKKSFSEYVTFVRITNAQKLLMSTDDAVTKIASECGFATSSYSIKVFKRYYGGSPTQFRKSLLKKS